LDNLIEYLNSINLTKIKKIIINRFTESFKKYLNNFINVECLIINIYYVLEDFDLGDFKFEKLKYFVCTEHSLNIFIKNHIKNLIYLSIKYDDSISKIIVNNNQLKYIKLYDIEINTKENIINFSDMIKKLKC
jgi:hypothetical protein